MSRRLANPLIVLGVVTVVVNALVVFLVIPEFSSRLSSLYNQDLYADGYDQLAGNLAAGNGYRFYPETASTLMREPGYPMALAGIFLAFGKSFWAVKAVNLILALLTAWLMTRLVRRISSSQLLVVGAPLLFLFHPGTLIAESRGGGELLFAALLTLFLVTVYTAIDSSRLWRYVVSGGVLGLTVLVKSTPMLFPLVLFGYLIVAHRDRSQNLSICLNIAAMVLTMLAVLSPWIIRNYRLTGKFVPTASVLGISAHAGQYICSHLSGDARWFVLDREAATERRELAKGLGYPFKEVPGGYYQLFYSSNHELEFSSYLLKRVVHEYQESPGLFARCTASNLLNIWFAGKTWRSTGINVIVQLPFLVLAVIGAVLTARDGRSAVIAPLVLFLVYYVAVYAPILAQARYSVPVIPFISVLAGRALVAAHRRGVVDRAALA